MAEQYYWYDQGREPDIWEVKQSDIRLVEREFLYRERHAQHGGNYDIEKQK